MEPRLLEQRAAPANARELERVAARRPRDSGDVRGERQSAARRDVGEHLVAAVRSGGHESRRAAALEGVRGGARPGSGRVGIEAVVGRHERVRHPERAERARGTLGTRADEQGRHGPVARKLPREGERLQGELVDGAGAVVLDEQQHVRHHATPSSRIRATTAGAAVAPSPITSACLPCPSGTTSRSRSSLGAARSGASRSTGFLRARSLAGTEG